MKKYIYILLLIGVVVIAPLTFADESGGGGGCGGGGGDGDCDGYESFGYGGFYDPYDQDWDDNDANVGSPCSSTTSC